MIKAGDVVVGVPEDQDICPNPHPGFITDPRSIGRLYRVVRTYTDATTGCYMLEFREDEDSEWCHGTFRKLQKGTIPHLENSRVPEDA